MTNTKNAVFTVGPPCSGKTSWFNETARSFENEGTNYVHVNRDDIRQMLSGGGYLLGRYRFDKESFVTRTCETVIEKFLEQDKITWLFVTDTFMNEGILRNTVYDLHRSGVKVFVKTFFDLSLDELVMRHGKRVSEGGLSIPYHVMETMYSKIGSIKEAIETLKDENRLHEYSEFS